MINKDVAKMTDISKGVTILSTRLKLLRDLKREGVGQQ